MTSTGYIRIYAGNNACGWAPIEVSDGCTTVKDGVKSTVGGWEVISTSDSLAACIISGSVSDYSHSLPYGGLVFNAYQNEYWLAQETAITTHSIVSYIDQCQFALDPNNPTHYTCIPDFAVMVVPDPYMVNDVCFTYPEGSGYRSYSATHHKTVYKWVC